MSDQEDNFQNNEEYEENENMEEMNQGEEQYEEENMNENGEEEGQGVFAFDIQINEDQFLLVIGKTDENKLLIRLIDKDEENKPFFQNEFSLDDLRNINPFFNNIDDENIVFQYIISNLNDADKEIKIVDQDKITLILTINEEDERIVIPFELYKTIEVEGDEEENMMEMNGQAHDIEGNLEEGVEVMQHDIGEEDLAPGEEGDQQIEEAEIEIKNLDGNEEINEHHEEEMNNFNMKGNVKGSIKGKTEEKLLSNLPLQIGGQSNVKTTTVEKKEISNENGVETIIEKKEVTKITSPNQNQPVPEIKKEITIIKETKVDPGETKEREKIMSKNNKIESQKEVQNIQSNNNEDILLLKEELLKTIESLNENFNNQLLKQSESFTKIQKEMKEESDNKLKEMTNELNKKINDLNDMKNKYENMNKKMDDIQNSLNENKKVISGYEGKINEINNKVNNLSEQINNINKAVNEQIEKNNKKLMDDINNLSKKLNEKLISNSSTNKEEIETRVVENGNQEELNEFRTNLNTIEEQIEKIKKDIENNKNNGENNFKSIKEEMNGVYEKIKQNNEALLNINNNKDENENGNNNEELNNRLADLENVINDFESKINNLENDFKKINTRNDSNKNDNNLVKKLNEDINNKLSSFENIIKNLGAKVNNLENISNNNQANPPQESNNQYDEKILELENITKDIEARINDYDFDKLMQNISFLMEKANDAEVLKKMNNLETRINQIKEKVNKPDTSNRTNDISPELINKINELENSMQVFEDQFQKIENQNKNNYNSTSALDKKTNNLEKKLANISKLSEDLQTKTETLFKVSKNLENITKDLDKRTYEIMNNMAKMPPSKESTTITKNLEKFRNLKKNNTNNNADTRVRQEKGYVNSMPAEDNRGIQKGINANYNTYSKGKRMNENINNNIIETNNGYQIMIKTKENIYNNNQQMPNPRNYEATYSHTLQPGAINKLNYIDSKIVDYDDIIFLTNRIREMHPKINNVIYNLVYRASEDGDKASDFHSRCDKIGPNITLIKTKKGFVFGGFTFKNWEHMPRDIDPNKPNLGSASRDARAFGFSVNNQKIYNNEKPNEFAIWCNRNFGPTFKNNLFQIFDSCLKKGGYCSIKSNSHFGGQNYDYEISGGESRFKVEELEVYEVKL